MTALLVAGYAVVAVVAALCSLAVAGYAGRRRSVPAAVPLSITAVGSAIWAVAAAGMRVGGMAAVVRTFHLLQYVGITLTVAGLFTFALAFTGRDQYLTRRLAAFLAIEPTIVVLAYVSNSRHGLLFESSEVVSGIEAVATTPGPLFYVHAVYSYVLLAVTVGLLVQLFVRSQTLYRRQALAVVVASCVPLAGNVAYVAGAVPVDFAPVLLAGAGAVLAVAIYRYRFVEVAPVARNTVVEHIEDPVVVVDQRGRVVDLNPTARTAFEIDPSARVIGSPASTVLPADTQPLLDSSVDSTEAVSDGGSTELTPDSSLLDDDAPGVEPEQHTRELVLDTPSGRRYYDPELTGLTDQHGTQIARLLLLRDVTKQHHQQAALKQQNEQLEQFASVVSHDLRNPLAVAQGYTEIVDGDHAEEIATSLDRMETIIDDVLTLARQGQTVENTEQVDLETTALAAWDAVDTADSTIEIVGTTQFLADEPRLRRLFENLFRNAIEHGSDDSVTAATGLLITVGPIDDADGVGFFVADNGPGIPPARRDAVIEAGVSDATDGTGLGLSIVNGIAQAHGWSLSITEGDAGGARFEFRGVADRNAGSPND